MGDCMPKEQADYIYNVQQYCLDATNMTEEEAYNFAFRCWQLDFEKRSRTIRETKVNVILKLRELFELHFGTYTEKGVIKVRDIFSMLNTLSEELLEGSKNGL